MSVKISAVPKGQQMGSVYPSISKMFVTKGATTTKMQQHSTASNPSMWRGRALIAVAPFGFCTLTTASQRSIKPAEENDKPKEPFWPKAAPYVVPIVAAGGAIVVPYRLYKLKTAQQLGEKLKAASFAQIAKAGVLEGAPAIAGTIGLQFIGQGLCEEAFRRYFGNKEPATNGQIMLSTIAVTLATIPGLAIFNGFTMNKGVMKSLRGVTLGAAAALALREVSFLASQRFSDPASKKAVENAGDDERVKWVVKHTARFATGAVGSLAGHPCDTIFSRLQKGQPIGLPRTWAAGIAPRTLGAGLFTVGYNAIKDNLT